jgi:type I restriction enzyme S subunit
MNGATANPLPSTWLRLELGDVVAYGSTEKAEPETISPDTWVLELEDIEKDTSRIIQKLSFAERQSKSTKNRFDCGDVLYGKLRPYLNKVIHADQAGVCTTEIVPIKPNLAVNGRFLYHWLRHPEFLTYVTEVSHGVNMPRLGTEAGRAAPFVLAPLPEQKRIADKLDSVLARVDACRDRLDRLPALLKRFRQSILAAATSGQLTEDWRVNNSCTRQWTEQPLGAIILEMRNGLSPKPSEQPPGAKILRISSVRPGKLDFYDHRYLVVDSATLNQYQLKQDDLLFTRYNGSLDFVGVCAIVPELSEGFVYPDKLIRVRVDRKKVAPKYVEITFGSQSVRSQVEDFIKSSAGQKGISGGDLKTTNIPIPPLPEQTEIVRRVEILFAFADRLEARLASARRQVSQLTPALLAKAFRGELVAQDPADEPASELLKRLAAQREAAPKAKRTRAKS